MSDLTYSKPYPDDLKKSLIHSLVAHILLVAFFSVKMVFFPNEDLTYQAAVRVDLVALPDKIDWANPPAPPPPPATTEKPEEKTAPPQQEIKIKEKTTVKEPDTISLKKKQKEALAKLKAMEAIERIKQEAAKEKTTSNSKATKDFKFKGNILSPGTELTGLNKLQHEEYIVNLDRHIKQYWTLPEWLAKKDYSAQIRVRIDDRGRVISKQLVRSSGNSAYDDIVIATIDKASPFPQPPEKFSAIVSVNGILIGFPE